MGLEKRLWKGRGPSRNERKSQDRAWRGGGWGGRGGQASRVNRGESSKPRPRTQLCKDRKLPMPWLRGLETQVTRGCGR